MRCDMYPCPREATQHYQFPVGVDGDWVDVDLCYHHATYQKSKHRPREQVRGKINGSS